MLLLVLGVLTGGNLAGVIALLSANGKICLQRVVWLGKDEWLRFLLLLTLLGWLWLLLDVLEEVRESLTVHVSLCLNRRCDVGVVHKGELRLVVAGHFDDLAVLAEGGAEHGIRKYVDAWEAAHENRLAVCRALRWRGNARRLNDVLLESGNVALAGGIELWVVRAVLVVDGGCGGGACLGGEAVDALVVEHVDGLLDAVLVDEPDERVLIRAAAAILDGASCLKDALDVVE